MRELSLSGPSYDFEELELYKVMSAPYLVEAEIYCRQIFACPPCLSASSLQIPQRIRKVEITSDYPFQKSSDDNFKRTGFSIHKLSNPKRLAGRLSCSTPGGFEKFRALYHTAGANASFVPGHMFMWGKHLSQGSQALKIAGISPYQRYMLHLSKLQSQTALSLPEWCHSL